MPATPVIHRRRVAKTLLVAGLAPIFAAGAWLAPAAAAEGDESHSGARFVDGVVFGTDLDKIAELAGVDVENLGSPEPVTKANPLDVTVLDSININVPGGVQVPLSDIIKLGAANQWATAEDGATSHAATGAVADNGAVGTGVDAGFPANATFDLTDLLGEELTDLIADVKLEFGALSSEAHLVPVDGDFEATRDYQIAGGKLVLTIPALGSLGSLGSSSLKAQQDAQTKGIDIDVKVGTITIDFDKIFESLNNLPPNSELIGPALFDAIQGALEDVLGEDLGDVLGGLGVEDVTKALADLVSIKVNVQPDQPDPAEPTASAQAKDITSQTYSVAAMKVTLLGGLDNDGASVTLAESHVGPNTLTEQETEVNGQETEVNGTETEVNGQETEVNGTETEVNGQETEVNGTETEVNGQETEVNGQETEVNGQETEVNGQETEVNGTETEANGTETEVNGNENGSELPDTGAGSSQLLILGLGLMFAGGIAAYAVTRRRGLTQE